MNQIVLNNWYSLGRHARLSWIGAAGAAAGMIVASFSLPGGEDLYRYYLPFVEGCLDCGFVPYTAQWALAPLRLLPLYPLAWPMWTIVVVIAFLLIAYFARINPILFMISFPFLGQVWLGQVDVIICGGLLLFVLAKNPFWRGVGLILALTKPQLSGLPILLALLLERPAHAWKLLVPAFLVFVLSLAMYGPSWPAAWLTNSLRELPEHVWRMAGEDTWKLGLLLLPVPLLLKDQRKRVQASLLVSALATPFFGVYSYVTFLIFEIRGWHVLLSYGWALGYFWFQESAMRFAWILPLAMLVHLLYVERRAPAQATQAAQAGTD